MAIFVPPISMPMATIVSLLPDRSRIQTSVMFYRLATRKTGLRQIEILDFPRTKRDPPVSPSNRTGWRWLPQQSPRIRVHLVRKQYPRPARITTSRTEDMMTRLATCRRANAVTRDSYFVAFRQGSWHLSQTRWLPHDVPPETHPIEAVPPGASE
jgi:hypothetical protein